MKVHHLRNATLVIETGDNFILVDPMLGKKGTAGPTFTLFRFKPQRNPIVDLPSNAMDIVEKTTHCLITHLHPDHLDKEAENFLRTKQIPVICSIKDETILRKKGLNVSQTIDYWITTLFLGGKIQGIPAVHGYGFVAKPMGNVMGFYIELPKEKSIYLSADTIYTDDVHKVLTQLKPEIAVVASGTAQLDIFQPLLMRMDDILKFVKNAPNQVIANHLEAVNHCPTTRQQLKVEVSKIGLSDKVFIPNDEEITYCFTFPNTLLVAYSSFITQNKSEENLQALTDSEIISISKKELENLAESNNKWLNFLKIIAEKEYVELEKWIFNHQKSNAQKRYVDLINNYPQFVQQIPLHYIASYLGITQRHLSRIRASI